MNKLASKIAHVQSGLGRAAYIIYSHFIVLALILKNDGAARSEGVGLATWIKRRVTSGEFHKCAANSKDRLVIHYQFTTNKVKIMGKDRSTGGNAYRAFPYGRVLDGYVVGIVGHL
jgi:hypothetical protein